ncbi:MAG: GNAT family N-acetyltransferase [Candidatus Atribacteria bacterium]|nr:GNAT family N-acetyltransferase [Candidatus Atribacteria bacterium]
MKVTLKALDESKLDELQKFMTKCSDFLEFQEEHPVKPEAAEKLFNDHPKGYDCSLKQIYGIYINGNQPRIGIAEVLVQYPKPTSACVGLFMLDPSYRHRCWGDVAYRILEKEMKDQGVQHLRLGVLEKNKDGFRFWVKMGYTFTGERKPYLSQHLLAMEKELQ